MRAIAALLVVLAVAVSGCASAAASDAVRIEIHLHYSHYTPSAVTVPAGRPITFVLINDDPIDHEWIVGDLALHLRHRTGTELRHEERPTEVTIDALTTRETTVTFASPSRLTYICHLPGHEAYGMVGVLTVTPAP